MKFRHPKKREIFPIENSSQKTAEQFDIDSRYRMVWVKKLGCPEFYHNIYIYIYERSFTYLSQTQMNGKSSRYRRITVVQVEICALERNYRKKANNGIKS